MTIATFSVPIDIPWQRIAFSRDMMDKIACDRELPLRWNSSVAVFEYEPHEDQQRLDGFKISYLKVACTITGYQPAGAEIRIREQIARSGWSEKPYQLSDVNLSDAVDKSYACYGAMLEVVVAPPSGDGVRLEDYPYFADFDPKKRELYELVTDTGEVMSRSLEDVGVRLGQTTSQSHEVRDTTSVGAELGVNVGVAHAGGSYNSQSGTTDVNQRATENVRTTDAARENRETLSHTTQLSQMYHQLNSYHLGTNRAAFFVLPRPHVVQSNDPDGTPRTFVDGPRQLEGVQEFMLVVVRPKDQERICVEAYLETAHLSRKPRYGAGTTATIHLANVESIESLPGNPAGEKRDEDAQTVKLFYSKTGSATYPPTGSPPVLIDKTQGVGVDATTGLAGGYDIVNNSVGITDIKVDVASDHITVRGNAIGYWFYTFPTSLRYIPAFLDVTVTVYLTSGNIVDYEDTLFITGRAVCSCTVNVRGLDEKNEKKRDLSVVFEKQLAPIEPRASRGAQAMSIHDANRLGISIHREMMQSVSSADRYPRGMVGFLDTQLVSGVLAAQLPDADTAVNRRLSDWPGIQEDKLRRVTAYSPSITRMQLLQMPLARQVESFGLSFTEAVDLRRALTNLVEPIGPRPMPQRPKIAVPLLTGLQIQQARTVLAAVGLVFGAASTVDSPLPSGVVVAQEPAAGVTLESHMQVSVKIASGLSVRLPEVIGLGLTEAGCHLRDEGLRSEPTIEGQTGPEARVAELEPQAGTLITPHAAVTIRLKR